MVVLSPRLFTSAAGHVWSGKRDFEQGKQAVEIAYDEAIESGWIVSGRAVEQNGRDAGCTGAEHVEHIRVADVQSVVGDGVGALECGGEEGGIGLGVAHDGGDDREGEVAHEIVVA